MIYGGIAFLVVDILLRWLQNIYESLHLRSSFRDFSPTWHAY